MQRTLVIMIGVLLSALLTACQGAAETPQPQPTQDIVVTGEVLTDTDGGFIVEPVVPDNESGIVRGRVLSVLTSDPLTSTVVAMAEVTRQGEQGAFVLNTASSPMNVSDIDGYFVITNVPPGEYVMVVGDPYERYEIIENPDTQLAQTYFIEKGRVTEVGELRVDIGK